MKYLNRSNLLHKLILTVWPLGRIFKEISEPDDIKGPLIFWHLFILYILQHDILLVFLHRLQEEIFYSIMSHYVDIFGERVHYFNQ